MKQSLSNSIAAAVVVLASGVFGTQALAKDTLIDLENARVGGFGGPVFKTSQIKDEQTFEFGVMGGATFTTDKHSILLGGAGYGLINELDWNVDEKLEMGYGGFIFGYTYNPEAVVHIDTTLLLGAGGVHIINENNQTSDSATFLLTELSSQIEVNVTDFLEIGIGGSYRLATNPSIDNLSGGDLSNSGMFVSFQFSAL